MQIGEKARRGSRQRHGKRVGGIVIILAIFFLIGLAIFVSAENHEGSGLEKSQNNSETGIQSLSPIEMERIPGGEGLSEFNLYSGKEPDIGEDASKQIEEALGSFKEAGYPVGFVFLNYTSGQGIAANADVLVYGASSIKGPFASYVCEALIDGEEVELTDSIHSYDENFHANGSATIKSLLMGTIEDSSNGMFAGLRRSFDDKTYEAWLLDIGVGPGIHTDNDLFAWYTPRDAAKLWTETYLYLKQGTETSKFLEGELVKTKVSFIRDGISQFAEQLAGNNSDEGFKRVTVLNKAGWCATDLESNSLSAQELEDMVIIDGQEYRELTKDTLYDSVCDNGIVTIDGDDFLLCVMSGARYCDSSEQLVTNLVSSIVATYSSLQ